MAETLLLIDGSNYLFRAYHALPDLRTSAGEPTGAIKGFVSMLGAVRNLVKPDYAACVFDAKGKTFRSGIYPEYKANRPPMPEDLAAQIAPIHDFVRAMGWVLIEKQGVEADDVIGTLALRAKAEGIRSFIATGDKDLNQLVEDGAIVTLNTMSHEILDEAGVKGKFGVPPSRIIDYLALMGDKVDNVPGINKCGPKTAAKWIETYGSLEGVCEHAAEVKGKIGEYLREGLAFLPVARDLVTIRTSVELPEIGSCRELLIAEPDSGALSALFERWEMRTSAARVKKQIARAEQAPETPSAAAPRQDAGAGAGQMDLFATLPSESAETPQDASEDAVAWSAVETASDARAMVDALARVAGSVIPAGLAAALDGTDFMRARLSALAVCAGQAGTWFVPLREPDGSRSAAQDEILGILRPWLEDASRKAGFEVKLLMHAMANDGIALPVIEDVRLQDYVIESHNRHEISRLAQRWLHRRVPSDEEIYGKGAARREAHAIERPVLGQALAEQAAAVRALHARFTMKMEEDAGQKLGALYRGIELPVEAVLYRMERTGTLIDIPQLEAQSRELALRIEALEKLAWSQAGEEFNIGSPKQLAHVLFEKLGLPAGKKTASGGFSTDEDVLAELAVDYPLPGTVLSYRALSKLKSTYTDKLPKMVYPGDGRVHTTFGQTTAVTGRLASSDPNLQNIPVRTEEGRRVRCAFVAPAGWSIVSADYSQIELRIMAHISGDPGLMGAFLRGMDVHRATASEVFGVAPEQVSADQRRMAKVINFGLIYGMSAFGLARNLGVPRKDAARYIEQYFTRYPLVRAYMDNTRAAARERGYVETAFGRRLWLPDIRSSRAAVRAGAERQAINAPMQGTAADLIKMAMVAVQQWLDANRMRSRQVLQVHDEIVLEVPDDELEALCGALPGLMTGVASLRVPLEVSVGRGPNWEAAH